MVSAKSSNFQQIWLQLCRNSHGRIKEGGLIEIRGTDNRDADNQDPDNRDTDNGGGTVPKFLQGRGNSIPLKKRTRS